ncbi:MAG: FkbM family methyltransferase [Desulfobacterales bacterium]|nr:FkbM family methyltransferase [Desulfobacterales bacterium]
MKNYSQNDEQKYILEHFKDVKGKFLDIGAYDGKLFSNSFCLVESGWSGVDVEASPVNFVNLMRNVRSHDVELVCAAVTVDGGMIEFYDSQGDAISSSNTDHVDKWSTKAGGVDWQIISIPSITVAALLQQFGKDFNMIDIDVEGSSFQLFVRFPWEELRHCSCVIIEHDGNQQKIIERLAPLKYKVVYENAENLLLTRN